MKRMLLVGLISAALTALVILYVVPFFAGPSALSAPGAPGDGIYYGVGGGYCPRVNGYDDNYEETPGTPPRLPAYGACH